MNVLELLDQYRIAYTRSGKDVRHGWAGFVDGCPWCGRPYLAVNLSSAVCNCWQCGTHSLADVLVALGRVPLPAAITAARGVARLPAAARPASGKLTPPAGVGPLLPPHAAYLRARGFDPAQLVRLWGLGAIGLAPRLAWRIYIPIFDEAGRPASWTTRAIGDRVAKRYHAATPDEEAVPAKSLLYGAQYCRAAVVVHEGPADVWATGPGAVATMGLSVTPAQVNILAGYAVRVICFDAEPDALRRAGKLAEALAPYPGVTEVVELESGNDAASADPGEIAELRAKYLE